jgi:hypothetical protein
MSIVFVAAMMMVQATDAQTVQPQPAPQAAAPAEKEKKICKVDQNESSSRLRKRVCMTPTEWERVAAGRDMNDLKTMGSH